MESMNFSDFRLSTLVDTAKAADLATVEHGVTLSGITRYNNVWDKRTHKKRLEKIDKPKGPEKYKHLLAVKREIDREDRHTVTDIEIRSETLAEVFRSEYGDLEESQLRHTPPVASPSHFYHLKERFAESLKAENGLQHGEQLKTGLLTALQYVNEDLAAEMRSFETQRAAGKCSWDLLWMLLCPGSLVYHWHDLTEQHQVLHFQKLTEVKTTDTWHWKAICNIVADDGSKFGIATEPLDLHIAHYDGAKDISALELMPLELKDDHQAVKEEVLARGKVCAAIGTGRYFETSGVAMKEVHNLLDLEREGHLMEKGRDQTPLIKFSSNGLIADASSFRNFQPNSSFLPKVKKTLDRSQLSEVQLMICSPVALGFSFGRKDWCGLPMSHLRPINWDTQLFNSLVIDPEAKTLIYSLVKQKVVSDKNSMNTMWRKGGGVIGLLDGNPGCGKTFTAEAVAEIVERPLYEVSAGELGVTPNDVDKRLSMILDVAFRWNAVVLLDEADVFLRKRDTNDAKRNALVSIFLRQLERFRGIMIMTTNRLEDCDPAFESRVSFSISYEDLTEKSQRTLWRRFLKTVGDYSKVHSDVSEHDLMELSQLQLNGREIKNTVASANAIALQVGEALTTKHIKQEIARPLANGVNGHDVRLRDC